jgi:hypothetical protein
LHDDYVAPFALLDFSKSFSGFGVVVTAGADGG